MHAAISAGEFQRIQKLCMPLQMDTSRCTHVYIEIYPGKIIAFQKAKPLSSKQKFP